MMMVSYSKGGGASKTGLVSMVNAVLSIYNTIQNLDLKDSKMSYNSLRFINVDQF